MVLDNLYNLLLETKDYILREIKDTSNELSDRLRAVETNLAVLSVKVEAQAIELIECKENIKDGFKGKKKNNVKLYSALGALLASVIISLLNYFGLIK